MPFSSILPLEIANDYICIMPSVVKETAKRHKNYCNITFHVIFSL